MKNEEKFGVALTKKQCFVCLTKYDGDIIMNTRLTKPQAEKVTHQPREIPASAGIFFVSTKPVPRLDVRPEHSTAVHSTRCV